MRERTMRPMKVMGSVPTGIIRHAYLEGGEAEALKVANEIGVTGVTNDEILAIGQGTARIAGDSEEGFRLEMVDAL